VIGGLIVFAVEGIVTATVQSASPQLLPVLVGQPQLLGWLVSPIAVGLIVSLVVRRRAKAQRVGGAAWLHTPAVMPSLPVVQYPRFRMYGVNWRVTVGYDAFSSPTRNNLLAYTEGPYCQYDNYELDERRRVTLFGGTRYEWTCAICHRAYKRPKDNLFHEDEVVGKIAIARTPV
jgi:hypothetical protein